MIFRWFFAPLAVFVIFSVWVQSSEIPPAFTKGAGERLLRLTTLPAEAVLQVKLLQDKEPNPLGVSLLGNSVMLPVAPGELVAPGQNAFNFAVPGTSFQASVSLLESLARKGREIEAVIVQVDNFEAINVDPPLWPGGSTWWASTFSRLISGLVAPQIGMLEVMHMIWRAIKVQTEVFKGVFNVKKILSYLSYRFPDQLSRIPTPSLAYSEDGSMPRPAKTAKTHKLMIPHGAALPGFFAHDLTRAAILSRKVGRLVLVEMPLEPTNASHFSRNPTPNSQRFRTIFLDICKREHLECYLAPVTGVPGQPNYWADATHPPARWLADHLRRILIHEPLPDRSNSK
jgi:hypothetical protein